MSYLVLARKWRPRRFAELAGQEHVVRALSHALDSGRIHHAFLFTGTRGVGKTTVARIFAKALNCDVGVSSVPCGVCVSCREIDEGRFVDLIEVDAASRTKVEDTRDLLENVQYAPSRGRYKVYLIDEVHMLSAHSFNALLKTLEEPPPHVKFLLATTDPQKLPVTVLSRCLQFHLKRLTPPLIIERMREILASESIDFEPAALPFLARAADGSLRDALSLLDQVLVFGAGRVVEADVRSMLGTIDRGHVVKIVGALAAGDAAALLAAARTCAEHAPDFDQVLAEIASLLVRVALTQAVPDSGEEGMQEWEPEVVQPLAATLQPEDVQLYYQLALLGRRDLAQAPDPQTGFEMTLLRMLAFKPADVPDRTEPLASPPGGRRASATTTAATAMPVPGRGAPLSAPMNRPTSAPGAAPVPAATGTPAAGDEWQALVASLKLTGAAQQLAANCAFAGRDQGTVRLVLEHKLASLRTPAAEDRLAQALARHYGTPITVAINHEAEATIEDTPARRAARDAEERLARARSDLDEDPTVRALKERFGASVPPDSVKPVR